MPLLEIDENKIYDLIVEQLQGIYNQFGNISLLEMLEYAKGMPNILKGEIRKGIQARGG